MINDIILLPQEKPANATFDNPVLMTRGFQIKFNDPDLLVINTLNKITDEQVHSKKGADYLQRAIYNNIPFWIIDDGTYVTFLLPTEY